ncbi:hypothetical protein ACFQ7F_07770 [Streptomyces sp. NPDC056486]
MESRKGGISVEVNVAVCILRDDGRDKLIEAAIPASAALYS